MPDRGSTIAALVIARDEAVNLPDCLDSLAWADERVVVVDSASRDATEAIARSRATRVLVRPFDDFAHQRNAGLAAITSRWVFAVDADERSSSAQEAEIRRLLSDPALPHAGFRVPIRSEILGRSFRYSGTQLDRPLRLFDRRRGSWSGAVHETVGLDGTAGMLVTPLLHRTIPDMSTFVRKLDQYTTLEARKLLDQGRATRAADLVLRPIWTFMKLYFCRRGLLDGWEGFAFCAMSAVSVAVRDWKLRELAKNSPVDIPSLALIPASLGPLEAGR